MWTAKGDANGHCYKVLPNGHVLSNISGNQFGLFNADGALQWRFRYPPHAFPRFYVLSNNDIIVTCPAQQQQKAAYVCLNLKGEIKWQFSVVDTHEANTRIPIAFRGNAPLRENAFLQYCRQLVFAVDENGNINWVSDSLLLAHGETIAHMQQLPNAQGVVVLIATPEKHLQVCQINAMGRVIKMPPTIHDVTQVFDGLPKDPLHRGFWLGFSTEGGKKTILAFFSWEGEERCRITLGDGIVLPTGQCDAEGHFYYPHAFHPQKPLTLFRKINADGAVLAEQWIPGYLQKPPAILNNRMVIVDDAHELLWGFNTDFQKTWGPYRPYFSLLGTNLSGRTLWELGQPEFLPNGQFIYGVMGGRHAGTLFCLRPPDIDEPLALPHTAAAPPRLDHKYD